MLQSISQSLAPGFYCRNETKVPILVVLSQLSPLHWLKIEPGETGHLKCGRVFFTVSVEPWVEGKEPTAAEVAARLAVVVTSTVFLGTFGLIVSGVASGVTSYHGVRKSGIYANGRTMVVRGRQLPSQAPGTGLEIGKYELYIFSFECASDRTKTGVRAELVQPLVNAYGTSAGGATAGGAGNNVNYTRVSTTDHYGDYNSGNFSPNTRANYIDTDNNIELTTDKSVRPIIAQVVRSVEEGDSDFHVVSASDVNGNKSTKEI